VATFRPETSGPDFDVDLKIENTDMRSMNDILRTYGKCDVAAGRFPCIRSSPCGTTASPDT
jgi:hypothetical protein